jgi:23S rRNA pseudouridine1911/1915/1917 synthase
VLEQPEVTTIKKATADKSGAESEVDNLANMAENFLENWPKAMSSIISSHAVGAAFDEEAHDDLEVGLEGEVRKCILPAPAHGLRLDRALADVVPEFSRNYLQQLMAIGAVKVNGAIVTKPSLKAKAGEEVVVELRPTQESLAFIPEVMPLDIVFEDAHLTVINKPAGLVVHPAPGNWRGTLLNGLLARHAGAGSLPRAGIVHRLDKDTSGLMVVGRTRQAMDRLASMIASRKISREYVALAHADWQGSPFVEVTEPLGRDPRNRLRMAVVDLKKTSGKQANTTIHVLAQVKNPHGFCLVRCILGTGRTHQIRVHMAFLKHPLVADQMYGGAPAGGLHRQALHACKLRFDHPVSGVPMAFFSTPPPDFLEAQRVLGLIYNEVQ